MGPPSTDHSLGSGAVDLLQSARLVVRVADRLDVASLVDQALLVSASGRRQLLGGGQVLLGGGQEDHLNRLFRSGGRAGRVAASLPLAGATPYPPSLG